MPIQYVLSGGQLYLDKKVFTGELLMGGPLKKLLNTNASKENQPKIIKSEDLITIDFNESDLLLDEGFYDLFKQLKMKYRQKLKGRVVIRITSLNSCHVVLNLNSDDKVIYE